MSDVAAVEVSADPPPEAAAEIETGPLDAAEAPGEPTSERTLPFDVEHLGPLRGALLDHWLIWGHGTISLEGMAAFAGREKTAESE
jgi:hypothetical protein